MLICCVCEGVKHRDWAADAMHAEVDEDSHRRRPALHDLGYAELGELFVFHAVLQFETRR